VELNLVSIHLSNEIGKIDMQDYLFSLPGPEMILFSMSYRLFNTVVQQESRPRAKLAAIFDILLSR